MNTLEKILIVYVITLLAIFAPLSCKAHEPEPWEQTFAQAVVAAYGDYQGAIEDSDGTDMELRLADIEFEHNIQFILQSFESKILRAVHAETELSQL